MLIRLIKMWACGAVLSLAFVVAANAAKPKGETAPAAGPAVIKVKDLTPVKALQVQAHPPVVLVNDGVAQATVYVMESKPRAKLKTMVQEMVDSIRMTTGAELRVVWSAAQPPPVSNGPTIVVGDCEASRFAGIDASKIPVEGFVVKTIANRIFLVGSTVPIPDLGGWPPWYGNDGTAWAISDFLERLVGVRWYWPLNVGGRSVVETKTLAIKPAHYTDAPAFRYREYIRGGFKKNESPLWYDPKAPGPSERAFPPGVDKADSDTCLTALRHGDSWPYFIKVHEPQEIWKNKEMIHKHPELFQLTRTGKRYFAACCYSSPKTFQFLIDGCEAVWDKKQPRLPAWENHYVTWVTETSVTVSPVDGAVNCACEACQASFKDGGAAKHMARFVKKMCVEVKRRWPGKKVMFLPYWNYASCPTDIEFPDNLVIQVCTKATGLPRNPLGLDQGLEANMAAWAAKSSDKITTWEYMSQGSVSYAPFNYPHIYKAYYTRNRDRIAGSFINGSSLVNNWTTQSQTSYCLMKILWNPDVDVDAIMDVFCERMFGKGSRHMRRWLQISCDRYEASNVHPGTGDGRENKAGIRQIFPPVVVAEMTQLWQAAREALKKDPAALQRFEYFTWSFEHFQKAYSPAGSNQQR